MARQSNPDGGGGGSSGGGLTPEERRLEEELDRLDEQTAGSGGASTPSTATSTLETPTGTPGSGGFVRAPDEPESGQGTQTEAPDTQTPTGGTPDTGGIAGAPGSDTGTVDPEISGQAEQARQQIVEQNEGIDSPSDIRLTGSTGNQFQFELSDAERRERQQDLLDRRGGQLRTVGAIQQRQPDFFDFEQAREDFIDRRSGQIDATSAFGDIEEQTIRTEFGEQIREAEERAETESFTFDTPFGDFTLEGQARELDPVITETDDGITVDFEQQDRAVSEDIDWSFGMFGPGDEVEAAPKTVATVFGDIADTTGDLATAYSAQRTKYNPSIMLADLLGADVGTIAQDPVDPSGYETPSEFFEAKTEQADEIAESTPESRFFSSSIEGAAAIPGLVATLPSMTAELAETGVSAFEAGQEGNLGPFAGSLESAAAGSTAGFANYASENPASFSGSVFGSLAGSAAAFKAASLVGPRTSAAARWSIQPGEEALGYGGFAATRAVGNRVPGVKGEAAAQKLFPNREPLLFSEEAALRGLERFSAGVGSRYRSGREIATGEQSLPPTVRQQDIIDRFRPQGGTGELTFEGEAAGEGFAGAGGELGTGGTGSLFGIETVTQRGTTGTATETRTPGGTEMETSAPGGTGDLPLFGDIQEAGGVRPFIRGEDLPPSIRPSQFETFLESERAQAQPLQLRRPMEVEIDEPTEFTDYNVYEDTLAARQQSSGTFEGEGSPFGQSEIEERIRRAQAREARVETEQETQQMEFLFETALPGTESFQDTGVMQFGDIGTGFDVGVDVDVDTRTGQEPALDVMQELRTGLETELEQEQRTATEVFGFTEQREEFEFEFETETETESEFEFEFQREEDREEFAGGLFGFQPQGRSGETFENPLAGGAEFLLGGSISDVFGTGGQDGQ